jgi:hypothetical protein
MDRLPLRLPKSGSPPNAANTYMADSPPKYHQKEKIGWNRYCRGFPE